MTPENWQRLEGAVLAAVALFAASVLSGWWWPLALFLAFDLSALGYLANTRVGAFFYNLVHSYWAPPLLLVWAFADAASDNGGAWRVLVLVACSWFFHVGVDRALGYGLKHADSFQHTHLGWIGNARRGAEKSSPH